MVYEIEIVEEHEYENPNACAKGVNSILDKYKIIPKFDQGHEQAKFDEEKRHVDYVENFGENAFGFDSAWNEKFDVVCLLQIKILQKNKNGRYDNRE